MRIGQLLIVVLASLPAGSALAGRSEARCTAATAIPATIDTIQKDFKDWSGRCVRLRGLELGQHLFTDRMATLKPIDRSQASANGSIDIYPEKLGSTPPDPAMVEIIGKLDSCTEQRAAFDALEKQKPRSIIMMTGYCHMSRENYVDPVSITVTSNKPITRLTEKEVPSDRRPLTDAPNDLPHRAAQIATMRAFVTAIAAGDEATWEKLLRPPSLPPIGTPLPEGAFLQAAQTFAGIRPDGSSPERIFVDRTDVGNEHMKMVGPQLIACWCKTGDCTSKWPVTPQDADVMPERPYVCLRATMYIREGENDGPIGFDGAPEPGLAEPDWSKYPAAH